MLAASLPGTPILTLPWRFRFARWMRRPELFNIVKLVVFLLKVYTIVFALALHFHLTHGSHFVVLGVAGLDFVGYVKTVIFP